MTDTILCQLSDIDDGESTGLMAEIEGARKSLIAVRQGDNVFVYINMCPHIGAPLDFEPGRFLNLEKDLIQCAMHGALFTIEDGRCVEGPCMGAHLKPVAVTVNDGDVILTS